MISTILSNVFALPSSNLSMVFLLAKATLILVAALAITVTMRRASAGARHLVWLVTLGTLLLVPALTAWAPLRLAILPQREPSPQSLVNSQYVISSHFVVGSQPTVSSQPAAVARGSKPVAAPRAPGSIIFARLANLSGFSALLAIWAAIVVGLALWLAYGALAVRAIVRGARPLDTPDWLNPLYEVSDRLGIDEAPRLLRSEDAKMPFACSVLQPTIVLPAECDNWTPDRRLAVLLHELAHVRRHDLVGHTLGRLACAIYWFHPLVWTAAKQLRSESERACDDLALSCGARPSDYAEHLLDIVTSVRHDSTPAVALAMARRKEFEGRMLAILDPELRHSSPSRWQSAGLIASLAVVAIVVGAAAPAPRASQTEWRAKSAAARREGIALAPAPKVEQPTVSKIEQSSSSAAKAKPEVPNSGRPGAGSIAQQMISQIVESTRTVTQQQMGTETKGLIDQKTIDAVANKAAHAAVKGAISALGGLNERLQGKSKGQADDRPALLANILKTDSSASLRRIAAWGLSEYAETSIATEALATALRRDPNAAVREMAAWALAQGDNGNPTAMDALMNAVRSDSDSKVRQTALWALGEIGDRSAQDVVIAALSNSDASTRMRAAWGLGQIGPKQAPPALVALLRDPDREVREITAWALYEIQDPSAAPALNAALKGETDKHLQLAYIRALASAGEKSVDAIRPLLESKDPEVRSLAVRVLAGSNGAGPWPWPWPQPRPFP